MNYKKITLPNGLRVITVSMREVKSVAALLLLGAGSRYEEEKETGLSHFVEHMLFKGTSARPRAQDIAGAIDMVGGEINAFTGEEYTGFTIKVESHHLSLALDVLSDIMLHSLFRAKDIDRERGVIIEEINLYEDTPSRKVGEVYKELLYGGAPLGRPIAGTKEVIRKVLRSQFLAYMDALYVPHRCVIALAGNLPKEPHTLVENAFSSYQRTQKRFMLPVQENQQQPRVGLVTKKTEQAHLMLGVRSYPLGHSTRYAEGLMNVIMGGNMSSRLFISVRERHGLAYAIRAASDHYHDCGNWGIYAGCDIAKIERCIRVILSELARLTHKGVSAKELAKAQDFVIGKLALDLEDSQSVASMYASQELLENRIRTPEEIIASIRKVSREEIHAVAQSIIVQNHLNLAIVGPFEDTLLFEKLLVL